MKNRDAEGHKGVKKINFATFQHAKEATWRAKAVKALSGNRLESPDTRTDDGLSPSPIYPRKSCVSLANNSNSGLPLLDFQRLDDPDSERSLKTLSEDISGGAKGFELIFPESATAGRTGFGLDDLDDNLMTTIADVEDLSLRIDGGRQTQAIYSHLRIPDTVNLTLVHDPIAEAAARGRIDHSVSERIREVADCAAVFSESGREGAAIVADGRIWASAGASEAQELAGILGSFLDSTRALIDAGLPRETALATIGLVSDAGPNQTLTIAKFRALRLLHARIVEAFELPPVPARIHAETSWRMMTRYDVHTNILRTTSAAFAASVGGADSITILPFSIALGLPDGFARRIARNAQTIFVEESGLGRVADPGAGSGAIETLTAEIAETAWEIFSSLEKQGGLLAALSAGVFQQKIEKTRLARAEKIARRVIGITGISEFPGTDAPAAGIYVKRQAGEAQSPDQDEAIEQLVIERFAEPFEILRDRATRFAADGNPARVFLASIGAPDKLSDTTQSVLNFFAIGGLAVSDDGAFDSAAAAVEAFSKSGTSLACILGTPDTLLEIGEATAASLKSHGATHVCIAGSEISGPAIDALIGAKTNAVRVLGEMLDAAAPTSESQFAGRPT